MNRKLSRSEEKIWRQMNAPEFEPQNELQAQINVALDYLLEHPFKKKAVKFSKKQLSTVCTGCGKKLKSRYYKGYLPIAKCIACKILRFKRYMFARKHKKVW